MPHPHVSNIPYAQEGRKAIIYQLKGKSGLFAFKIFKEAFRLPHLIHTCQILAGMGKLALGDLEVCARQCVTSVTSGPLLQEYPHLEYSVLMPWIHGATWHDIVAARIPVGRSDCIKLVTSIADILAGLETHGYAH